MNDNYGPSEKFFTSNFLESPSSAIAASKLSEVESEPPELGHKPQVEVWVNFGG